MKTLPFLLFVFSQSLSAADLSNYTSIDGITDLGKTIEFSPEFNFDKKKSTASLKKSNIEAYYNWGSTKPEDEEVRYLNEIIFEKNNGKFEKAIIQTASKYSSDDKLRSATRCFPINPGKEKIHLDCVTASAQSCNNLLRKLDQKTKEGFYAGRLSPKQLSGEVNKCSALLKNYADLADAYALTTNDNARNAVVNSDMDRISEALKVAAVNSKWNIFSQPVSVLNNSKPGRLAIDVSLNLEEAPRHLRAIHEAINLCRDNKYMFRPITATGAREMEASGTP